MTSKGDPYTALGLAPGASMADIKRAYRLLVKHNHPDAGAGSLERFLEIQAAYEALVHGGSAAGAGPGPGRPKAARSAPGTGRTTGIPRFRGLRTAGRGSRGRSTGACARRRHRGRARPTRARSPQGHARLDHLRRGRGGDGAHLGRRGLVRSGLRHLLDAQPEGVRGSAQARSRIPCPGPRGANPGAAWPATRRPGGPDRAARMVIQGRRRPRKPIDPSGRLRTSRPAHRRPRTSPSPPGRRATRGWTRVRVRPLHSRPARPGPVAPARRRLGRTVRARRTVSARRRRAMRPGPPPRPFPSPGGRDGDGAWSSSAPSSGGVSCRHPGGIGGEPGRYDGRGEPTRFVRPLGCRPGVPAGTPVRGRRRGASYRGDRRAPRRRHHAGRQRDVPAARGRGPGRARAKDAS